MQCDYLDYSGSFFSGGYYCQKKGQYLDKYTVDTYCDNSLKYRECKYFKGSSQGSCYLTTAMCDILGFEDDCKVLNTLRCFRDANMKTNEEYKPLLEDYDVIGPILSDKMYDDENCKDVAKTMLKFYIKPAIEAINDNNTKVAIKIYEDMTLDLMDHYEVDKSILKSKNYNGIARKREIIF